MSACQRRLLGRPSHLRALSSPRGPPHPPQPQGAPSVTPLPKLTNMPKGPETKMEDDGAARSLRPAQPPSEPFSPAPGEPRTSPATGPDIVLVCTSQLRPRALILALTEDVW